MYEVILYSNDREGAFWQWKRFDVQVTVTNVNEPPVVVSGPTDLTRRENGDGFLGAYEARDPDAGDTASWDDLEGDDANHFRQDASGRLSFRTPPDFEARANNVYQVIVVASDDGGLEARREVMVTVEDVNEPPLIDGEAAHTIEENSLEPVGGYTKADPEGRATSWLSLMGADGGHFELDEFGELSFAAPPDFEARHRLRQRLQRDRARLRRRHAASDRRAGRHRHGDPRGRAARDRPARRASWTTPRTAPRPRSSAAGTWPWTRRARA